MAIGPAHCLILHFDGQSFLPYPGFESVTVSRLWLYVFIRIINYFHCFVHEEGLNGHRIQLGYSSPIEYGETWLQFL